MLPARGQHVRIVINDCLGPARGREELDKAMSRIKLVLFSALAVVAVSALASASASAAVENKYFVEKTAVAGATNIVGTVGEAQLQSTIAGVKMMIVCTENSLAGGQINAAGKSKGEIKFKKCKIFEIKNGVKTSLASCTVKEPIEFKFEDELLTSPGGIVDDRFRPEGGGNVFVTIKIEGSLCALKGTYEVKGQGAGGTEPWYLADLGDEGEIEKALHELIFGSCGSHIVFGTEPASFTNRTSLELESHKGWYVD